jgi:hypothetical protein
MVFAAPWTLPTLAVTRSSPPPPSYVLTCLELVMVQVQKALHSQCVIVTDGAFQLSCLYAEVTS